MCDKKVPKPVVARLPIYLHYLKTLEKGTQTNISSGSIAQALGLGEVQVRKDLGLISGAGKPKVGYKVDELINHIEKALGTSEETKAVIVGAGKLGLVLLGYEGFKEFGINILAAFDKNSEKLCETGNNKRVLAIAELKNYCVMHSVKIGIITVPEKEAVKVYEELKTCGVSAVWNFAPVRLAGENGIKVRNENMAAALAVLAADL